MNKKMCLLKCIYNIKDIPKITLQTVFSGTFNIRYLLTLIFRDQSKASFFRKFYIHITKLIDVLSTISFRSRWLAEKKLNLFIVWLIVAVF